MKPTAEDQIHVRVGFLVVVVEQSFVLCDNVEEVDTSDFDRFRKMLVSWKMKQFVLRLANVLMSSTGSTHHQLLECLTRSL